MRRLKRGLSVVAIFAFLAGLASGRPALAQGPDFTNVTDILAGRRVLFPVDDLIVAWPQNTQFNQSVNQVALLSQTGQLSGIYQNSFGTATVVSGAGRMFDLPYDASVVMGTGTIAITTGAAPPTTQFFDVPISPNSVSPNALQFPKGDFTGDGFADFAFILNGNVYVVTAQDVGNPSAGLFFSDAGIPPFSIAGQWAVLAAGDFDGDGTAEVALASSPGGSPSITITIYKAQVTASQGQLQKIQLVPAYSYTLTTPAAVTTIVATAGNFGGIGNATVTNSTTGIVEDQLLLVYKYSQNGDQIVAALVGLNDQSQLQAFGSTTVRSGGSVALSSVAQGYLSFPGTSEQAVVSFQGTDEGHLTVLTVDATLNMSVASETRLPGPGDSHIYGVAVGNFGYIPTNATDPFTLVLQLAVFTCDQSTPAVHLYSVDPSTFSLGHLSQTSIQQSGSCDPSQGPGSPAAGDLQGRSLVLGPPTVVRVRHLQPHIVLGMPPAHVDWVIPANGAGPEVLNLSAVSNGFFSSFQTVQTNQNQSSRQSTTGYSQSITESVTAGYQWGNAETGSASASVTVSSGQMWENSVKQAYDTFATTTFDASSQTGFDDEVWFVDERHNLYVYPVIGRLACPADNAGCSDPKPLNVTFSGPDSVQATRAAGSTVEWYQPVQEPGNVFSYPWSLAQIQAQYQDPSMNLLTSGTPTTFYTDGSALVQEAQWQAGGSQSVTSGAATQISWGTTVSVSYKPGVEGGPTGSASLSYNGSTSISTLSTSITSLGESTGVGIAKPGTFPNPGQYQYAIQPFIFGTNAPAGTIQPLSDFFSGTTPVQTSGILHAAFTADPTDSNAGSWWQGAYPQADLALNHPVRWSVTSVVASSSPPNCIRIGATDQNVDCATFNQPDPDVWTSEFHYMKGLLITPASANGQGPQLGQATAGDQLLLQVRVYNYSLTDMPAGTEAVVRFYGQPWDTSQNAALGDAFLIDEVTLGPIPGFNSASNGGTQPNWALASTTKLDTASYSDQYLVFWVVVWIQDAAGRLATEMPAHGLTAIPGTLTDISQATPLLEAYSNNIGFYKYAFYIAPQSSAGAPGRAAATGVARPQGGGQTPRPLTVEEVNVVPRRALLNERVLVSAWLRAGAAPLDGVSVFFYDGHGNSDRVFDVESISHIRADAEHELRVPFRPTTCGNHTLVVATHPQWAANRAALEVTVDAVAATHQLLLAAQGLDVPGPEKRRLLELLRAAERAFQKREIAAALGSLAHVRAWARNTRNEQAKALLAQADLISTCVKP